MAWEPQNDKEWHDLMIELIIVQPSITNAELAEALDLNLITIGLVRKSDMFRVKWEMRKAQMQGVTDEVVKDRLQGKMARVADAALDNLQVNISNERKLLDTGAMPSQRDTRETAEMVLSALGYSKKGAAPASAAQVNANAVFIVDKDLLASARQDMRSIGRGSPEEPLGQQLLPPLRSAS